MKENKTPQPIKRPNTEQYKARMLKALEASLGVVTVAARTAGLPRERHYDLLKRDPVYAAQVAAIDDVTIDFAESQLHKQIKDGNTAATIFYLKTKGKRRGYIEKQELDVTSGGKSLAADSVDWDSISPEALEELRNAKLLELGRGESIQD